MRRVTGFTALVAAALLTSSIACGSQGPIAPSVVAPQPRPAPPAPIPQPGTDIVPAANGGVPGVIRRDVVMSASGTATVRLAWPDADFSLQLYVTTGACADIIDLLMGGCAILGKTRPGDLPGVVSSPVTSDDRITWWVLNPDPWPQGFTLGLHVE